MVEFPVLVDNTNDMKIKTNIGLKPINISPMEAMEFLDDANVLSRVKGQTTNVDSIKHLINMVVYNGTLAYRIEGDKRKYLFAFIPINVCKTVITSAEDNEILKIMQPTCCQILYTLSLYV